MSESVLIRATPPRATVFALLQSQGLPISDITDAHLEHFFFAGDDGAPFGLVGLEVYDSVALLRSLVVDGNAQRKGLGSALARHAESYAFRKGVRSIYLLTTTAEMFFKRLGYARVDRSQAPDSIARTPEFSQLCPTSSAFMFKSLQPNG